MQIRSFVIAYALVLAILLFADRRPGSMPQDRYSHVVDLTAEQDAGAKQLAAAHSESRSEGSKSGESHSGESKTRIIAPGALIPGTWSAGQIPPERLVAPLVVMDLSAPNGTNSQISLDDIAAWESQHGIIPQGAVVAIRRSRTSDTQSTSFPIARDAAEFLIDARYTIGFAVETNVDLALDRTLARQLALHGSYVLEGAARFESLPTTSSLIIVAPAKNKTTGEVPVRILAMVR
jgi:kynurenine formamidase